MRGLLSGKGHAIGNRNAVGEQQTFIGIYSFVGCITFVVFGLQYLAHNDRPIVGYLELAFAVGFGAAALLSGTRRRIEVAKAMMLVITFAFLMLMLTSGGTANTGLFWFFVFPVVSFFLTDARMGVIWNVLLIGVTAVIWQLPDFLISLPFSDVEIRQLLVAYTIVTLGVYFYQLDRDKQEEYEAEIDRAKSEFLTLASHQLRTPISAIGWLSEILQSGDAGKLNVEQKDHVEKIYASNQRLAAIVDSMLIVSGLELKQLEVRNEPVDLVALCKRMLADQTTHYADKQLQIREKYPKTLRMVHLDPSLMRIILQNVFSNACKYTPARGTVSVTIEKSDEILHSTSKGSVLITIEDSGYGITTEQQQHVFSKLFRAENIKARDTDGTGLGLYIVKEVLDAVGGRIWFTSQEGVGSIFYILLPLEGMQHGTKHNKGGN